MNPCVLVCFTKRLGHSQSSTFVTEAFIVTGLKYRMIDNRIETFSLSKLGAGRNGQEFYGEAKISPGYELSLEQELDTPRPS